jgi:hypothetical protein
MALRRRHGNSILRSLATADLKSLSSDLREIELSAGALVYEPHSPSPDIYFPIDCVISFVGDTGDGDSVEVWAAGNEGAAGISGIVGCKKPFRGFVQVPGQAVVLKAEVLRRHFKLGGSFHDRIVAYYNYLVVEASYLGICNSSHPIEHRLCRWLLMIHDRAGSKTLKFTQEAIAGILGTRRASISVAAAALQAAGLISYTPGTLTVRSRKALEKASCRCYRIINSHLP